ncbi:LOW QUALITY PROTEIN: C10orf113 isoform 2 [Pongo abelii]|uniref:C10orf113 isoform 2 n=1 Tax=Pongo abelii TaxID=9601 RepID=A0A2J8RVT9_PONAB|nr:LOW QUALITY PROTEIN: C10orf113 isoform 2 [Pongo abelii]
MAKSERRIYSMESMAPEISEDIGCPLAYMRESVCVLLINQSFLSCVAEMYIPDMNRHKERTAALHPIGLRQNGELRRA